MIFIKESFMREYNHAISNKNITTKKQVVDYIYRALNKEFTKSFLNSLYNALVF